MKRQGKRRLKRVAAESDEEFNDNTKAVSSAGEVIQSADPTEENGFAQELMAAANEANAAMIDSDKGDDEPIEHQVDAEEPGRARRLLKKRKAAPKYRFSQEEEDDDDADFDLNVDNDDVDFVDPSAPKERKQRKKREPQAKKEKTLSTRQVDSKALKKMNVVKTNNKLVGDIENNELYADDDLLLLNNAPVDEFEGQELEFDLNNDSK